MEKLEEKLVQYKKEKYYPFHMPGHKRNERPELIDIIDNCGTNNEKNKNKNDIENSIKNDKNSKKQIEKWKKKINHFFYQEYFPMDITEITDFDNLHHPEEVIKDFNKEMKDFYQTKATFMSVNGSTAGLLASISACTKIGDEVLIARNCHRSVLDLCMIRNLKVHYIMPDYVKKYGIAGGIDPEVVREKLEEFPNIKTVLVVSPTYEGVVSDISKIAEIVHDKKIPLIVDEAHGAHFPFDDQNSVFPKSAIHFHADYIIQSTHKTLPAPTQTALVHLNGPYSDEMEIKKYLSIYQTSSPSYVLMAGISFCFHEMKEHGKEWMREYEKQLIQIRKKLKKYSFIELPGKELVSNYHIYDYDIGKLVLSTIQTDLTGKELAEVLHEKYRIELEMSSVSYALAMTSLADTKEGFERLDHALKSLDKKYEEKNKEKYKKEYKEEYKKEYKEEYKKIYKEEFKSEENRLIKKNFNGIYLPRQEMSLYEADCKEGELIPVSEAEGRISKENLFVYPPGIVFLAKGEVIDRAVLDQIERYQKYGFEIHGQECRDCLCVVRLKQGIIEKQ